MPSFGERFGALIAAKREEHGLSFAQLAVAAYGDDGKGGESRKADVQKLEAGGSRKPNAATIRKYRLALDLTQEEIDACRTAQEIELAQFARQLFEVIAEAAKASGLSEDLALAVSDHYAQNNAGNFEGALAGLKDALKEAAKELERGRLPSNYEQAVDTIVARINALNQDGEVDQAYADLQVEAARRAEARAQQTAEDGRILDMLITQATLANDADGLAEAHLQRIRLESPGAEDSFHRLRDLWRERYEDGLRFGTPFALDAAAGLARKCAAIAPTSYLCAMAQNDLAVALRNQGTRTQGPKGAALLGEAVDNYRAALRVRTEVDYPLDWAMTMQNLAVALEIQSTRTQGPKEAALLGEAVDSYRAALRVFTEAEHPVDWAMTMQNLAVALEIQSTRTQGPKEAALLGEAVDSYRAALRVFTEAEHPVDWAMTMQNLAIALRKQGTRIQGPEGAARLGEAVDSYRAALRVYTEAEHPVDWAMTMQNLAIALEIQGTRTQGPEGAALLGEAVDSYRAALRVFTEADHPVQWAMTMQNLAGALQTQGTRTQGPKGVALMGEAVDSYRAALRVRTEADHPVQWAMTQENMAIAELARALHDTTADPRPHLEAALVHVDNSLRVYDADHMSFYYTKASALRDELLAALNALPSSSS